MTFDKFGQNAFHNGGLDGDGLVRLFESYRPIDADQRMRKEQFLDFLATVEEPCARSCYHPGHLTASVIALDARSRKVLLLLHTTLRRWVQPGGHVEPEDRSLADAAVRELLEETSLRSEPSQMVLFDLDIHPVPPKVDEPPHQHFDVRFLLLTHEKSVKGESAEAAVAWFPIDEGVDAPDLQRLLNRCVDFCAKRSGDR